MPKQPAASPFVLQPKIHVFAFASYRKPPLWPASSATMGGVVGGWFVQLPC